MERGRRSSCIPGSSRLAASIQQGRPVSDIYFANRKPRTSSRASYDTRAQARLWQISVDLAGLTA